MSAGTIGGAAWPGTPRPAAPAPRLRPCAVIPVFDNVATVATVAAAVSERIDLVIVVDDGSRDGSRDAARAAAAAARPGRRIEVVTLPANRGKGAALVAGFRRALELGCTHAVTVDADGQHRASDIPAFLAAARASPRAIVAGARDMDAARVPNAARVGRRISNFWTLRLTGVDLPDTTCGLRVYPVLGVLDLPIRTRRYDYEGEVLVRAAWAGLDLRHVPIDVWYPDDRAARVTHYRPWVDSVRITVMYLRLALRRLLPAGSSERAVQAPAGRAAAPPAIRIRDTLSRVRALAASGTHLNEIALALGIGVFVGATPLWGLHAILALYVAVRWRLNLAATFLATNVSFPLFAPVLAFAGVQCGHLLLHGAWLDLRQADFSLASVQSHLVDYVVGAFALAAVLGTVAGLGTLVIGGAVQRWRRGAPARAAVAAAASRGSPAASGSNAADRGLVSARAK